ncbi:hypothetical protein V6L77_01470 [Pannonibacter sp. Pt2-lr]
MAVAAGLVSLVFLIPYSAVQLSGVGYLLSGMTGGGIPFLWGVVISTVLAIIFSYVAGIRSVMWTDSLQALMMIVASVLVCGLVLIELGGFSGLFGAIQATAGTAAGARARPLQLHHLPGADHSVVLLRHLQPAGEPAPLYASFPEGAAPHAGDLPVFRLRLHGGVGALGLLAFVAFPDLEKGDLATSALLSSDFVPPVLGGHGHGRHSGRGCFHHRLDPPHPVVGLCPRRVSNVTGGTSDERQLFIGKLIIPFISVVSLVFAAMEFSMIAILSVAASVGLLVTVPAIIGAFFWRRGTAAGALVSILGGVAFVVWMYLTGNKLFGLNAGVLALPVSTVLSSPSASSPSPT